MRRRRAAAALASIALMSVGCGGAASGQRPRLTVSAAASLDAAFTGYGQSFGEARVRFSFGPSDALAAQIAKGVRPDLYAAANSELPRTLFRRGLVRRPVVFAGNRLVLAVPRGSRVRSLADLERRGAVKLVIGARGVPIGAYTRVVLGRLPQRRRRAILAKVRSNESDVAGVSAKLTRGAADAGFLYVTDVRASHGALRAIELPRRLRPRVRYAIAVVRGAKEPRAAEIFVDGLLGGPGRRAMRRAGFEPPGPG